MFKKSDLIPLFQTDEEDDLSETAFVRVRFEKLAIFTSSLALFAFVFCVFWSIVYHFDETTKTHCDANNYLPSISAAIGNTWPQRDVWKWMIAVHSIPRFFVASVYYEYNRNILYSDVQFFISLLLVLNLTEISTLLGLSFWTSLYSYTIHKICFVTFVITSQLYMISMTILWQKCRRYKRSQSETKSLKIKTKLCIMNVISFLLASYFFVRHNTYCESGIYTMFAICEYFVVFSNIAYHLTAYLDFKNTEFILSKKGVHLIKS